MRKITFIISGCFILAVSSYAQTAQINKLTTTIDLIIKNSPKQRFALRRDLGPEGRVVVDTAVIGGNTRADSLHFDLPAIPSETKFVLSFNKKGCKTPLVFLLPGDHLHVFIDLDAPAATTFTGSVRTQEFWDFIHLNQAITGDISKYQIALKAGNADSIILKHRIDSINNLDADFIRKTIFSTNCAGVVEFALLLSQNGVVNYTDDEFALLTNKFKKSPTAIGQIAINQRLQKNAIEYKPKPANGTLLAGFTLPDDKGSLVDFLKFAKGKYILLDFWASWCGPCRKETPYLREALNKFGKDNFAIVSVSIDENRTDWQKAIREDATGNFIHLIDIRGRNSPVKNQYNIVTIPSNFLIDPTGKIIDQDLRGEKLISKIRDVLPANNLTK